MATFDDYIQSLTLHSLAPQVADGALVGSFAALYFLSNAKRFDGETMKFPFAYRKNTSGKWYDGMDTLSTSKVDTRIRLSFEPRWFSQSVVMAGTDLDINNTKAGIIKLLTAEMEWAQQSMADTVSDAFYTLQSGKQMQSFLDITDDATDTSTYGGQTRSTYTQINGQRNVSGGTLTASGMATLNDDCSVGNMVPDLGLTSKTGFTIFEGLLLPTVQHNIDVSGYPKAGRDGVGPAQALRGGLGFDALWHRGVPLVRDEKCATTDLFLLNKEHIAFYSLASARWTQISLGSSVVDGPYAKAPSKSFKMYWSGLREPTAQDAEVGFFKLGGQFISDNPRLQGRMTGILQ